MYTGGMLSVMLLAAVLAETAATTTLSVSGFVTATDKSQLLAPLTVQAQCSSAPLPPDPTALQLSTQNQYQRIVGYGAAMTDSSATLLSNFKDLDALLGRLFGPRASGGVGFSLLRVPIGMSDFSTSVYTFDDTPGDYTLSQFSIAHDLNHTIPLLLRAQRINPDLRLILTPWTAPAWLKASGTRGSGPLLQTDAAYDTYAQYLADAVKAYRASGLNVAYITIQNEPLHDNCGDMPCMSVSPTQAAEISVRLGRKLEAMGLTSTSILAYDHNWDQPGYPIAVLSNTTAAQYVGGTAFHCYAGDVSAQASVYQLFPNKTLLLTECCGGDWAPDTDVRGKLGDFPGNLNWELANMLVGGANYFAAGSVYWNIALDENHGPKTQDVGGCTNCRGVTTVPSTATSTSNVTFNSEFYALAAMSTVVPIGSVRINLAVPSALTSSGLIGSAFLTTPGSASDFALVIANGAGGAKTLKVNSGACTFNVTVPEGVVSLSWSQ